MDTGACSSDSDHTTAKPAGPVKYLNDLTGPVPGQIFDWDCLLIWLDDGHFKIWKLDSSTNMWRDEESRDLLVFVDYLIIQCLAQGD